jgi:hypothetical protein
LIHNTDHGLTADTVIKIHMCVAIFCRRMITL